ncbi:unnamed protein product [Echinostoma caproni]|uniref:Retrotransposon gag domain-containing protein n=1 Tax=Echinostoma caproni TaxID=27848 RepID=A0A183AT59_9TREM|nr:unnamed protein product [Echinostoma caproni]
MPRNPKSDAEKHESPQHPTSFFGVLMQRILTLLSSDIHSEIVRTESTPSVPPPGKFHIGDDFHRWARAAQDSIELVPPSDRRIVLLSLIEGEANDIVRDEGVLDAPITPETFQRLRDCLTDRLHAAEFAHQFQTRIQFPGERLTSFFRALRRLAVGAFPDNESIDRDAKVLTQILVGTRDPLVRRHFLLNPPPTVAAALDTARRLEQGEAVLSRDQLPEAPTIALVSSRRPQRPFRPRYNQGRLWYPWCQPPPPHLGRRPGIATTASGSEPTHEHVAITAPVSPPFLSVRATHLCCPRFPSLILMPGTLQLLPASTLEQRAP